MFDCLFYLFNWCGFVAGAMLWVLVLIVSICFTCGCFVILFDLFVAVSFN